MFNSSFGGKARGLLPLAKRVCGLFNHTLAAELLDGEVANPAFLGVGEDFAYRADFDPFFLSEEEFGWFLYVYVVDLGDLHKLVVFDYEYFDELYAPELATAANALNFVFYTDFLSNKLLEFASYHFCIAS
jgi:hypothetical protein